MRNIDFYPVDGEKLKHAFEQRSLVMQTVSSEMGYDKGYMSTAIYAQKLRKASAIYLEKIYGIKPSEYAPDPEPIMEEDAPLPWETAEPNEGKPIPTAPGITWGTEIVVRLSDDSVQKLADAIEKAVREVWEA